MIDIKNILFWIFLGISIILLIWYVFGNSPTEFIALTTFIFTVLLKVWSIGDRQIRTEMKLNSLSRAFKEHVNQN